MLVVVIVATGIFMMMLMGQIGLAVLQQKLNKANLESAQALHIAEAGVNYYRWVLYHDHEEYCNKETCKNPGNGFPDYGPYGPYHYEDFEGTISGEYELYITPPALNGSTLVKIKSVGWLSSRPNIKRTIEVECGIPSWSTYSNLTNEYVVYGNTAVTTGPVHSNTAVEHQGIALDMVTASKPNYGTKLGVFQASDPNWDGNDPPQNVPVSAIYQGGRRMGTEMGVISFSELVIYAAELYKKATSSGLLFDPRNVGFFDEWSVPAERSCISSTCDEGYHIRFIANDRFELSKVSAVRAACGMKPSYSINTESAPTIYNIPANGIIFVKNNVWVDGQVNNGAAGTRVTIVAFKDPFSTGSANIIVNRSLLFTNYDGTDSIGLIAQNDFRIGMYSDNDLRIDASIIAVNGKKANEDYSGCLGFRYNKLTVYGSQCSNLRPYTGNYNNREYNFDGHIMFSPPPHFPTTGQYTFISWEEK